MPIKITKLDQLFSQYIRSRAGWKCERCGTQYKPPTSALHCSHFWGRSNMKVRYDPDNANAHCYGCHQYLGSRPVEFHEWKLDQLGEAKFKALNQRANWPTKQKVDLKLIEIWLKNKLGIMSEETSVKQCEHKLKPPYCSMCHIKPKKKEKKPTKEVIE